MPEKSVFASRLAALRHNRQLSQPQLADATGLSKTTVNKWEAEGTEPSLSSIAALATFFGCTADYLVGLTDHPEALPEGRWLVDQRLYERCMAGDAPTDPNEALGVPIPAGARIVDSATFHRMSQDVRSAPKRKRR